MKTLELKTLMGDGWTVILCHALPAAGECIKLIIIIIIIMCLFCLSYMGYFYKCKIC